MDYSTDIDLLLASQRREFMAASVAESDLELAFGLQMEEALFASTLLTSSTTAPTPSAAPGVTSASNSASSDLVHALDLQSFEMDRYQQERSDADLRRTELLRAVELRRIQAHDERFAREIDDMPEDNWEDYGDEFERPIELLRQEEELPFQLYFKGMARMELVQNAWKELAGIGVAVCDPRGDLFFKIQKPVHTPETNREMLEAMHYLKGSMLLLSWALRM